MNLINEQIIECAKVYTEMAISKKLQHSFIHTFGKFRIYFTSFLNDSKKEDVVELFKSFMHSETVQTNSEYIPSHSEQARKLSEQGKSYSEIARILGISDKTAKKYSKN